MTPESVFAICAIGAGAVVVAMVTSFIFNRPGGPVYKREPFAITEAPIVYETIILESDSTMKALSEGTITANEARERLGRDAWKAKDANGVYLMPADWLAPVVEKKTRTTCEHCGAGLGGGECEYCGCDQGGG